MIYKISKYRFSTAITFPLFAFIYFASQSQSYAPVPKDDRMEICLKSDDRIIYEFSHFITSYDPNIINLGGEVANI